jgi:hypothetical protein
LPLERHQYDAQALASEAVELARPEAASLGCGLELLGGAGPLTCDRQRVVQALGYVLAAELARCSRGGSVRLEVRPAGGGVAFRAWAEPEVAPDDDPTTRHRHALAHELARALVAAHRGAWEVEPRLRGLPRVRFVLP